MRDAAGRCAAGVHGRAVRDLDRNGFATPKEERAMPANRIAFGMVKVAAFAQRPSAPAPQVELCGEH